MFTKYSVTICPTICHCSTPEATDTPISVLMLGPNARPGPLNNIKLEIMVDTSKYGFDGPVTTSFYLSLC